MTTTYPAPEAPPLPPTPPLGGLIPPATATTATTAVPPTHTVLAHTGAGADTLALGLVGIAAFVVGACFRLLGRNK